MSRRTILTVGLAALTLAALPARACVPIPLELPLAGESADAYKVRVAELERVRSEQWARERESGDLQRADTIFIGRFTYWYPPYRPAPRRRGAPIPPPKPIPVPDFNSPGPSYFRPIDWFRGARVQKLVRTANSNTSCGPMGFGDTTFAIPGDLFVFFARKGPISQKTLIDAIAVDKIADPALLDFVAKYRRRK